MSLTISRVLPDPREHIEALLRAIQPWFRKHLPSSTPNLTRSLDFPIPEALPNRQPKMSTPELIRLFLKG